MKRVPAVFLLVLGLASACAKDKGNHQPTTPAEALSSNNQCAMLNCQRPPSAKPSGPATNGPAPSATSTSTSTDIDTEPAPAPEPEPQPDPQQDKVELNDTQKMAKNAVLVCKDGHCDPSVGLLSIVIKENKLWNAGQCTASLVGRDTLATNGHCIPPDLIAPGSSCRNRLWITFARDRAHPEYETQIDCDKVLFRRKDGGMDGADYAYLKLAHASRRPVLRMSQAGFEENKGYSIHKVNPGRKAGAVVGTLENVGCRSIYESAIFPAPLDRLSQTSLFVDCNIIPGNSGSPILGPEGAVRGVIYAFVRKDQIRGIFAKNGSTVPGVEALADLNVGSNFACLNLPGDPDGRAIPAACGDQLQRVASKRAAFNAARVKLLRPAARKLIAENEKGHADVLAFDWTLALSESQSTGTMATGVPECVNAASAQPFLQAASPIHRPLFAVRGTYDKYLRESNLAPVWKGFATAAENLQLSKAEGGSAFRTEIDDPDSAQTEFQANLAACGK